MPKTGWANFSNISIQDFYGKYKGGQGAGVAGRRAHRGAAQPLANAGAGKPSNPGTEDQADRKAQKGEHIYTYDCLNRMVSGSIAGTFTSYTYDTLGNLTLETVKNKSVDYIYNELNQLVRKTTSTNDVYTYSYDKRGNRVAEIGPKASQEFVFDATGRMVSGTNWKGDESAYTYNGLGIRVNNTHTTHAGQVYERDYVIDYTSFENDDLYVYAMGNGQLEYEQLHVYAGSERIEQFTERGNGNWERTLYVHEDVMGNTRYYTKTNGQSFAELEYDAWGMPASPNKLLNNDHGNYVFATFTGHIYDTTLDMYFAEARFYDAGNRQWLSIDPVKDGLNWYLYCYANPQKYFDPDGEFPVTLSVMGFGALVGGAGAAIGNLTSQLVEIHVLKTETSFDYGELVSTAVNGAISGAISLSPMNFWGKTVVTAMADMALDALNQHMLKQEVDARQVIETGIASVMSNVLFAKVGDALRGITNIPSGYRTSSTVFLPEMDRELYKAFDWLQYPINEIGYGLARDEIVKQGVFRTLWSIPTYWGTKVIEAVLPDLECGVNTKDCKSISGIKYNRNSYYRLLEGSKGSN